MKTSLDIYVIEQIRQQRMLKGMSQADLAFKMGVSYGFIGKVESKNSPSKYNISHINILAAIFNVSPKDFFPAKSL